MADESNVILQTIEHAESQLQELDEARRDFITLESRLEQEEWEQVGAILPKLLVTYFVTEDEFGTLINIHKNYGNSKLAEQVVFLDVMHKFTHGCG